MTHIIEEVLRVWERPRERMRALHLFTNNLCLPPLMEIINVDPQGPPHCAQHTAVCIWPYLSHDFAQFLLSLIHFLPGRVRDQWQVSGIDATMINHTLDNYWTVDAKLRRQNVLPYKMMD